MEADQTKEGQFKASNVTGCTGVSEKGKGKGGPPVLGTGNCQGTVKSFAASKGWGSSSTRVATFLCTSRPAW